MEKVSLRVTGRVQGVGFRFMTKLLADQLGIVGIVRNEDDGAVYIEASGPPQPLNEFIRLVKASPSPSGRVDNCQVRHNQRLKEHTSFTVTY